ncbi:MAG TPA: hypothetical protein EYP35_01625 [Desulfobacterales bacterium]|nr:hypothetical protein [Desulfobacterales bacterium]HIP40386.1 hypothetical protein [Desulfocapsa sulfexigens]
MLNKYWEPYIVREVAPFKVDGLAIPYPEFVPRLYNFCKALGFRKDYIIPSRAFCSDENQGLPIILLTKHFGSFPFNHGRVGGMLAIDRHGPHSHHGDDLIIVQASHVGYDPDTGEYGTYHRPQLPGNNICVFCGKITHVITPYLERYKFACARTFLWQDDNGRYLITTKNSLIDFGSHPVEQGLVLKLSNIVKQDEQGVIRPVTAASTTQTYEISDHFKNRLDNAGYKWKRGQEEPIGRWLTSDLFHFKVNFHETDDSILLEKNLIEFMPDIVSAKYPSLRAAKTNVQLEFARVVKSRTTQVLGLVNHLLKLKNEISLPKIKQKTTVLYVQT